MPSVFCARARDRKGAWRILHCIPCSYSPFFLDGYPHIRHRKPSEEKQLRAAHIPTEKDREAMSFLEKKVEDLKLIVSDTVRQYFIPFLLISLIIYQRMTQTSRVIVMSQRTQTRSFWIFTRTF